MLRFAYNTNGCCEHRLGDALELIAEAGYQGVSVTLDPHHLDPTADDFEGAAAALRERLRAQDLALVVATGARFLADPREPHEPTLLHPTAEGRARRLDIMRRAVRIAAICGAEAVTFASGRPKRVVGRQDAGAWLLDGLAKVADFGAAEGVALALVPEAGHMVAAPADFALVREAVAHMTDAPLRLGIDAAQCLAAMRDPAATVKAFAGALGAVAVADARRGTDGRLPFGSGDLDLAGYLAALDAAGYEGLVTVELPLHSHRAHQLIGASLDALQAGLPSD